MTSAYGGEIGTGTKGVEVLDLPLRGAVVDGVSVEVDNFQESEWPTGLALLDKIIEDGLAWPFEEDWGGYKNMDGYRGYFLSHAAFVVRSTVSRLSWLAPASRAKGKCRVRWEQDSTTLPWAMVIPCCTA